MRSIPTWAAQRGELTGVVTGGGGGDDDRTMVLEDRASAPSFDGDVSTFQGATGGAKQTNVHDSL
jgi:hypothetical protein